MITEIERAIVARLTQGLGSMVRTVKSYNGEADDLAGQMRTLPAVWVTYGGSRIEPVNTSVTRYRETAEFVVMAATRNLRNEQAQRQGGPDMREVGSNDLIYAVRRLLDGQRLGGLTDSMGLTPKAVRTVANSIPVSNAAISIYGIEYTVRFDACRLPEGRFAELTRDQTDPDYIFSRYQGASSPAYPWFERFDSLILDPTSGAKLPVDINIKE